MLLKEGLHFPHLDAVPLWGSTQNQKQMKRQNTSKREEFS